MRVRFYCIITLYAILCAISPYSSFHLKRLYFKSKKRSSDRLISYVDNIIFPSLYTISHIRCTVLNALILQEAADGIAEAFVGGTVGVMSVALYLELKKLNEKNLEACPYCVGNGEILCGGCLGSGVTTGNSFCTICGGRGLVMCINCKGDGRETPILLVSKAVRNPVSLSLSCKQLTSTAATN